MVHWPGTELILALSGLYVILCETLGSHKHTLRHVSREPERPARICRLGRKSPRRPSGRSRRLTSRTALNYVPRSHIVATEALRRHNADRRQVPRLQVVPLQLHLCRSHKGLQPNQVAHRSERIPAMNCSVTERQAASPHVTSLFNNSTCPQLTSCRFDRQPTSPRNVTSPDT